MMPWEDRTLLLMIRKYIDDGGPLEPIADRCIEMEYTASSLDCLGMVRAFEDIHEDVQFEYRVAWDGATHSRSPRGQRLGDYAEKISDILKGLGHTNLANYIPF